MPILGDSTVWVFNSLWTPHAHTAVKGKGYKSTASSRCFTFRAEFISLLEAACDDVVSTEQYETPTQQQLSILTPPTGFRTEARTDACETQCDEEGDHGELTTPLTTNAANMIGLKKECTELQCDPAIAPLSGSIELTPASSSTPPQTKAPPTGSSLLRSTTACKAL